MRDVEGEAAARLVKFAERAVAHPVSGYGENTGVAVNRGDAGQHGFDLGGRRLFRDGWKQAG